MKKAIITLCIALAATVSAWAGGPAKVEALVRQYKGEEGFEVVTLGRLGISLIKGAVVISGDLDAEDRAALKAFSGIKKLVIMDFEDADPAKKARFTTKLEKVLDKMELIMEARDSSETMRIYGVEDGGRIKDCILYSSDGALIYAAGSIDMDRIGDLMEMQQ
ncbi:MAG: DUF4252 domain-containing protein [Bacteroidales bacterium]|nr:DUF4252 domain-containing protein [Bacteroidales bacterium]